MPIIHLLQFRRARTTYRSDHHGDSTLYVSRSTEIRVGLVSIASILILIVGIMIGKGVSFSPGMRTLAIRMASSGGLEPGSPVVVNGVKRGQVSQVVNNSGSVLVMADVNDASDLRSDAYAVVTILEITGGKKVEISTGTSDKEFDTGKEMPGRVAADIGGLITSLGEVSGSAISLVRRLDTISAELTNLLRDGTFTSNIKTISSDGAVLVTDMRTWFQANGGPLSTSISDIREITSLLRASVNRNEPKVSQIIDRMDKVLLNLESTLAKADGTFVSADTLVARINGIVQDIRTNKSLLNMLIYDDKTVGKLDTILLSINKLLRDFGTNGVNVNIGIGHTP